MSKFLRSSVLLLALVVAFPAWAGDSGGSAEQVNALNTEYNRLLGEYVFDHLVDYDAWTTNKTDKSALDQYVDQMAALDPADWPRSEALAYWLNLYNAVTLQLVLNNYPLDSIKDIGGFMKKSPWKRELVTVGGRVLTLNNIENDVIRPTFHEPRIHFALNCASLGCPPLAQTAFDAEHLSTQLDAACRLALNQERWVKVAGEKVLLTKIFDWYRTDFEFDGGSVLGFVRRYRTKPLPAGEPQVEFMSYDWHLNRVSLSQPHDAN